jgi:hypothetical protein
MSPFPFLKIGMSPFPFPLEHRLLRLDRRWRNAARPMNRFIKNFWSLNRRLARVRRLVVRICVMTSFVVAIGLALASVGFPIHARLVGWHDFPLFHRHSGWTADLDSRHAILEVFHMVPVAGAKPISGTWNAYAYRWSTDIEARGFVFRKGSYLDLAGRPSRILVIKCPLWALTLLASIFPARVIFRFLRKRAANPNACASCGYDLRATPLRCPECGMRKEKVTPERASDADRRS